MTNEIQRTKTKTLNNYGVSVIRNETTTKDAKETKNELNRRVRATEEFSFRVFRVFRGYCLGCGQSRAGGFVVFLLQPQEHRLKPELQQQMPCDASKVRTLSI